MAKTKRELSDDTDYLMTRIADQESRIAKLERWKKGADAELNRKDVRIDRLSRRLAKLEEGDE